jgi:erythromycin esterase
MRTITLTFGLIILTALFSFGDNDNEQQVILENSYPISSISPSDTDFDDLRFLADILKDKRIVLLGEQGHRDGPAFEVKTRLIKYLHEELGYNLIAFEGATIFDMLYAGSSIKRDPTSQNALKQFRAGLYHAWSGSLEFQEMAHYIAQRIDSLSIIGLDNNFWMTHYAKYFPVFLNQGFDLKNSSEIDYDRFLENYNKMLTDFDLIGDQTFDFNQIIEEIQVVKNIIPKHETISSHVKDHLIRELDNFVSFINGIKVGLEAGVPLRSRQMAENLFWALDKFYPDEKVIIWTANFHGVKNLDQAIYSEGNDLYQNIISMGQHIVDEHGEDTVYSIAITSSEKEIESETKDFLVFPVTTWEGRFAKNYDKDYAFINLTPIRESGFSENQFESTVFGRPIMGKWYNMFDGVVFIRRMEFSTFK